MDNDGYHPERDIRQLLDPFEKEHQCHIRVRMIPWLAALQIMYYRRDLLKNAGVDEKTAFLSPAQLVQTLKRLRAGG